MPRLLFLPGAGGGADFWRPVAQRLPADWPKHLFSWPGLGDQPHDPAISGLDHLVDLVTAKMDAPADIVAQSMGGLIAIKAALRRPDRVRSLVLTGTSGGMNVEELGGADWCEDYRVEFPDAAPWITEVREDLTAQIPTIEAPALLLWGDADLVSPVAVGRRLAALLPNAALQIVHGGAHDFAMTHAEEIAPLIQKHVERA
jgi:pimeloyl-ACP methyl ester carboxylesterase